MTQDDVSCDSLAGLNLKFILGRRAALAFAVGQPWFVWGLPVFSNVQYGGCGAVWERRIPTVPYRRGRSVP